MRKVALDLLVLPCDKYSNTQSELIPASEEVNSPA